LVPSAFATLGKFLA